MDDNILEYRTDSLVGEMGVSPTGFRDLDELVLECRDDRARERIREAVLAYRGGAYRSTIVATWVAIAFDYVSKLNELALSGDQQAQVEAAAFESIREKGDVAAALRWERALLKNAQKKFELLSPVELVDLERIQADRHRCAHPSMTSSEAPYAPTAELARSHIRNAVEALLRHPPVQGKAALDRLRNEIDSDYFPTDPDGAVTHFEHGPLNRPRDSLVRNLLIVLLKSLLAPGQEYKRQRTRSAALTAVRRMHPALSEQTLKGNLPALMRTGLANAPYDVASLIATEPDLLQFVPNDVTQMLVRLVKELPAERFDGLDPFLKIGALRPAALARLKSASRDELVDRLPFGESDPDIIRRMLEVLAMSSSFDQANDIGRLLAESISDFEAGHIDQLVAAGQTNGQVKDSHQFRVIISRLVGSDVVDTTDFSKRLEEAGLDEVLGS